MTALLSNSLCEGGVLLDFSTMNKVEVDASRRRAYPQPGAILADLDKATQAHGMATPVGTTGSLTISPNSRTTQWMC